MKKKINQKSKKKKLKKRKKRAKDIWATAGTVEAQKKAGFIF